MRCKVAEIQEKESGSKVGDRARPSCIPPSLRVFLSVIPATHTILHSEEDGASRNGHARRRRASIPFTIPRGPFLYTGIAGDGGGARSRVRVRMRVRMGWDVRKGCQRSTLLPSPRPPRPSLRPMPRPANPNPIPNPNMNTDVTSEAGKIDAALRLEKGWLYAGRGVECEAETETIAGEVHVCAVSRMSGALDRFKRGRGHGG
ncbi:hypothetical protein B0H14DRAFT_3657266 [Mycena olivaceomarginata]|nr:hypothetical protein B0H14DRAFT_3657266 [Mycena olivaceomarginata]